MGFSRQEYWSGLPFPSPVDHILSDLSTMTCPSWVAPRAWPSFIELDKAVVLVWLYWLVFCEYGFRVSALWCLLAIPTILLGFLLPWAWGISSRELPDVQARFRKGRGTRDRIANICWIMEKAREFQKNIYFCFIDYAKAFDCVDHNKLRKILKEMGIPDHLICLWRNLYAVRKQQLELDLEQQTGSK